MSTINKQKDYKVFVVGRSTGYASWIEGTLTKKIKEADLVLFTGGEDISPAIYKETPGRFTDIYDINQRTGLSFRDEFEIEAYEEALALNIPMWGTCRGAQLLCALAGGKLIQDMDHRGGHKLHFYDNKYICGSNSLHHQMQYPYTMDKEDYSILAYAYGESPYFHDGSNKSIDMPESHLIGDKRVIHEPEFVYYPKIKALGIQGHPEMMNYKSEMVIVCHSFLNLLVEEKIDNVLKLNIPVKDIMSRAWDFKFTKEERELLKQVSISKEVVSPVLEK